MKDFVSDPKQPEVRGRRATVVVQPAAAALDGVGATARFSAEAVDANGFVLAGQTVAWRSLNPALAAVDEATGTVTAVASGQAIIEARTGEGSTQLLGYALVTVSVPAAAAVSQLDTVASGTTEQINALWGSTPSNVYAAGALGTVLHFDGQDWARVAGGVTVPAPLWSVWGASPSDVYVVGDGGAVYHFDGQTWSQLNPARIGTTESLRDVWGASPRDVFVVGANGTIRRFNGVGWESMPIGTTANLRAVWGSSVNDVYAVGDRGTVLHYDGRTWNVEPVPSAAVLTDVWGTSAEQVLVVGGGGTVLRRRGGAWSSEPTGVAEVLNSVWGTSATSAVAAGDGGTLLLFTGAAWQRVTVPATTAALRAVFGFSTGEVFLGGTAGTLLATARATGPRLVFTRVPAGSVVAGDSFRVEVRVADGTGATVTTAEDTISLAIASGPAGAELTGTTRLAAAAGVATFSLRLTRAGPAYVLSATAPDRGSARSPSFGISPSAGIGMRFSVQPAATKKDSLLRPVPQVEVVDSFGNLAPGSSREVFVVLGPNKQAATLSGENTQTTVLGVATFERIWVGKGGNDYTLVATAPGVASARSDTFQVLGPGVPASVTIVPDGVTLTLGDTVRLQVEVRDGDRNLLPVPATASEFTNDGVLVREICLCVATVFAVGTGQSLVYATVEGLTGYAVVTVVAASPVVLTKWTAVTAGTGRLNGVWIRPNGVWFAVGVNGTFVNWTTDPPVAVNVSSETLRAVLSFGSGPVYAVSDGGALVSVNASYTTSSITGFTELAREPGIDFTGIWGASPTDLFIVGNGPGRCVVLACTYRFDGQSLRSNPQDPNSQQPTAQAFAIWGASRTDVVVPRASGVAHFGGIIRACAAGQLQGVWGTAPNDVFLVGLGGTIAHWDGSNCVQMNSNVTADLYGVAGFGPNDVYAVGARGTIVHYDGSVWSQLPSLTTSTLRAVAAFHQQAGNYGGRIIPYVAQVVAVGDDGVWVYGQP